MLLKVCGNNDLEAILNLEQNSKIDLLGYIFYAPSKRNLSIDLPKDKIKQRVGVFVNEDFEIIKRKVEHYQLDFVQLHGDESPDFCFEVNAIVPVIKVFQMDTDFDFQSTFEFLNCCNYFLFDTKSDLYGGSGKKFDWGVLSKFKFDKAFFISGGISFQDVKELKNLPKNCIGIDINSRFEIESGKKDYKLIETFSNEIK
jgi:phosphoribosylanthranilate isomerase